MISIKAIHKSLKIIQSYSDLLILYAALTFTVFIALLTTSVTYFVLQTPYIFILLVFALSFSLSLFGLAIPFFIGSKIQNKNVSALQCVLFAWKKKKFVFTHTVLRIILFPLKLLETIFSPLGKTGSIVVRPFEFLLGSMWQFSSPLTPATVVFGKATGIHSFRKTVLDTRKARGRKLRLKNVFWLEWAVYTLQVLLFTTLLFFTTAMNTYFFFTLFLLGLLIISATFTFFTVCKSTWHFALYIFLVSNKVLPPFSKNIFLNGVIQRV